MLQIIVLNGDLQGTNLNLFEGFQISSQKDSDVQIKTKDNTIFLVSCNSSGNFLLSSKNNAPLITVGEETVKTIDLMPGLIFSIGDVGFSVQESDEEEASEKNTGSRKFSDLFSSLETKCASSQSVEILDPCLSFKFVRGIWTNKIWTIPYQPISFGKKTALFFFLDESIPSDLDFLHLSKKDSGEDVIITSDLPNFISINGELINGPKKVFGGDLVEFGQTAFYIEMK